MKLPVPGGEEPVDEPALAARGSRRPRRATTPFSRTSGRATTSIADGRIALARALEKPPPDWDGNGNGQWDGFVPDVQFAFDEHGFDHRPDGTPTGWRAFAYYPFVGTFFPTNGSADDVLIRLDPALREDDATATSTRAIYTVNFAIVEALITRADVAIDPVDEAALGVDLDLDGRLGRATRVAFDAPATAAARRACTTSAARATCRARGSSRSRPGLFPLHTEFFHTVRYLDVGPDGVVAMAPRMKEVRYAKKARWLTYDALKAHVALEAKTTATSPAAHARRRVVPRGGRLQRARAGTSRASSRRATGRCGRSRSRSRPSARGATAASAPRPTASSRLRASCATSGPARGWFHWSQHDLRGIPEPRRRDGQFEYTLYLREAGAGDELRSNAEVLAPLLRRRAARFARAKSSGLHADIARLLLPSPARALDLDRAYRAVVLDQSFDHGRDAVLAASPNVEANPLLGESTGITRPVVAMRLAH